MSTIFWQSAKSHSLILEYSFRMMFTGFRSQNTIPFECRNDNALTKSLAKFLITGSKT